MAQTETKVFTAHVPLPLARKVDQMAARLERSHGWIMKQALSAWIDQEEERDQLTREALADVVSTRMKIGRLKVFENSFFLTNKKHYTPVP